MKLPHGLASKSSEILDRTSYGDVAAEYYDEQLHPTCADFRTACRIYLTKVFESRSDFGRIADIGCGRSLVASFRQENLCLIDESVEMMRENSSLLEKRILNIESNSFGENEFDWIFAVLGDPYNSVGSWINIACALKRGGKCVFIVPSFMWAEAFRKTDKNEMSDYARFLTSKGEELFLPSSILSSGEQRKLIESAGLELTELEHVLVGDLPSVRSPKISSVLAANQSLLDVYTARKAL